MFLIGIAATWAVAAAESPISIALPDVVDGWMARRPDDVYDYDTLFKYINGSAEIFRSFNVRKVVARHYVKEGVPDIVADVFDMGVPADAYGVYHHDYREGPSPEIGQESEYVEGALAFWRNRYYVSILTMEETPEAKEAIMLLGRQIDKTIPKEGGRPDIVGLLPQENQLARHVYYFHDHFCLNSHYFVAEENILDLDRDTEGVLGRYAPNADAKDFYLLAILKYPTAERAVGAYRKFMDKYMHDSGGHPFSKIENGKYSGAKVKDKYVIVVFDAPAREVAEKTVAATECRIAERAVK